MSDKLPDDEVKAATRLINGFAQAIRAQKPSSVAIFVAVEHIVASLVSIVPPEGEAAMLAALISDVKQQLPEMRKQRAEQDALKNVVPLDWARFGAKKGEA